MDTAIIQKKAFSGLITAAVLIAGGVFLGLQMGTIYRAFGLVLSVLGAIGLIFALLSVIGVHDALVLNQTGLSVRWLGRSPAHWKISWGDVSEFSVAETQSPNVPTTALPVGRRTTRLVGITFTPTKLSKLTPEQQKRMTHFRKHLACDEILPGGFGMSVDSLVQLLIEWKSKFSTNESS